MSGPETAGFETVKYFLRRVAGETAIKVLQNLEIHLLSHMASHPFSECPRVLLEHLQSFRHETLTARRSEFIRKIIIEQNLAVLKLLNLGDTALPQSFKSELTDMFLTEKANAEWEFDNGKEKLPSKREKAAEGELRILIWRWEVQHEGALERQVCEALGLPEMTLQDYTRRRSRTI